MSSPPEELTFVVDENLLRLGRALAQLRSGIELVGQGRVSELLPIGILDSAWIPIIGVRGWIMITNDQRIRTRPSEAELAQQHSLMVVHLHGGVGNQPAWAQAVRFFSRWEGIEKHIHENPTGPWWLSVRRDRVQAMRFEPGAAERA